VAQTQADIDKLNQVTVFPSTENASRSGTPGCDCDNALPLATGEQQYLPTVNTFLNNIINPQPGMNVFPTCLGSAPNQTWYEFTVSDTGQATFVINGQGADYDYVLLDATGFPCSEFTTFTGQFGFPQLLSCSYSTAGTEVFGAVMFPGNRYILVVTNFSNLPIPYFINIYSGIQVIPFSAKELRGKVYADNNGNCAFDEGDAPIANAHVEYPGTILHTYTMLDGTYRLLLPGNAEGLVQVSQSAVPSLLWSSDCVESPASFTIDVAEGDTMYADVPYSSTVECALPVVHTSTPFLRRCFTNNRLVQYGNYGSLSLPSGEILLRYEDGIVPVNIPLPYTFDGTYYRIAVEPLAPGQTGSFYIIDSLSCENGLNSYACVEASYVQVPGCYDYPQEWDGSDLEVHAVCSDSTTATFTITNAGSGNMSQPMPFEVRRNGLLEDSGILQLSSGTSSAYSYSNDNDLLTFVVWETAANPFNTLSWDMSDCNSALFFGGGSPAYAIQDQQPWLDIDCDVVIGAYDPNDKFAWPFGGGDAHQIERYDDLEYRIRFQNTGNDTAFTVVLVDTLSNLLNPETIRFTGNSHPYTYTIENQILSIRFENIQLPDSASNPEGSIGYIRFTLEQNQENPVNYLIENFADIYFDFNPPIRTNTAVRTVGEVALIANNTVEPNGLNIYPNPAKNEVFIGLPADEDKPGVIDVFDIYGKLIMSQALKASAQNKIELNGLSSGVYMLQVKTAKTSYFGKFVID
jgi:uncharacterized repeat protein (TIGR01451 family)